MVLAGAGAIGDSIGTTITRFITMDVISHAAERFITAAISITGQGAAKLAVGVSTAPAKQPGPLKEIAKRRADTRPRAARAEFAQVLSAAMTTVERPEAIHPVDELAPVGEGSTAVEEVTAADVIDREFASDSMAFPVIA